MTENNYNKLIDVVCELVNLAWDSTSKEEFERLDNAGADIIDCLEKLQQFEAIGTIEEFKALKVTQKMIEKSNFCLEQYRADTDTAYQCGYNKAIDEFAETLKEKYEEHNFHLCLRQNDYYSYSNSCILFENYIDKIAEQLKAGAENEDNS